MKALIIEIMILMIESQLGLIIRPKMDRTNPISHNIPPKSGIHPRNSDMHTIVNPALPRRLG